VVARILMSVTVSMSVELTLIVKMLTVHITALVKMAIPVILTPQPVVLMLMSAKMLKFAKVSQILTVSMLLEDMLVNVTADMRKRTTSA
jgi:hypothetical protein